jgi:hypothetical protein
MSIGFVLFGSQYAAAANITVTTNADTGPGSLRQAVADANPLGGDIITFDMDTVARTILLPTGTIIIDKNLIIQGPGANLLTVSNTMPERSVFGVAYLVTSTISGLTISGGTDSAIYNTGSLTVSDSTITGNTGFGGGGIYSPDMFGLNSLTVINSTISDNSVTNDGGGIRSDSKLNLINSTISGNSARYY